MEPFLPSSSLPSVETDFAIGIPSPMPNPSAEVIGATVGDETIPILFLFAQLVLDLFCQLLRNLFVGIHKHDPRMKGQIGRILVLVLMPCPLPLIDLVRELPTDLHRPICAEGVDDHDLIGPLDTLQGLFDGSFVIIGDHVNGELCFVHGYNHPETLGTQDLLTGSEDLRYVKPFQTLSVFTSLEITRHTIDPFLSHDHALLVEGSHIKRVRRTKDPNDRDVKGGGKMHDPRIHSDK
jgi:hypothetical protein